MSEQNSTGSAAPGHYGVAGQRLLTLRETSIAAAWNLQGNTHDAAFTQGASQAFGMSHLPAANSSLATGLLKAFWLGPSSWLLVTGGPVPDTHPLRNFTAQRDVVNRAGGALFDVSASRMGWTLKGPRAATVLASGCPLDLHPRVFPSGACAQSLFGHVAALVAWGGDEEFTLLVARSLSREVWLELCAAGAQYGYEVLAPAPFR